MSATTLERPTACPAPAKPDTMPEPDTQQPTGMPCPVCGSSSTYQLMGGGWGCVSCGSTWA
jgi:large subunit ribosomal protein L37Ae